MPRRFWSTREILLLLLLIIIIIIIKIIIIITLLWRFIHPKQSKYILKNNNNNDNNDNNNNNDFNQVYPLGGSSPWLCYYLQYWLKGSMITFLGNYKTQKVRILLIIVISALHK